ncbi:hypothetical protein K7X08_033229 [Anisodus acutangulus]|uniref:Uncharacterized protein n=1 Tax=Anisodus acutangulus TaxID=402998 RepID=A0A9Q1M2T7_9SOLA|nr:hypothetical protein K7X08_033229 [Anisodus acutangulus]
MEANDVPTASEMVGAQAHIYKHAFSLATSMVLGCAIQLGIPDVIHNHKQPKTLSELVSELKLPPKKSNGIHRLMCLLVYSGFFATTKKLDENEEGYVLTASSKLLLKSEIPNLSPFVRPMVDPVMDCKEIFEEVDTLVDVGGRTNVIAKTILAAFPHLKCTVLDLPRVVANMPETENLKYVGGDMFQSIPSADAIFRKHIMHNWSDEDCVKILKRSRTAIMDKDDGRKGSYH